MTLTGDTGFGPGKGINRARGSWRIPRSRGAIAGGLLMLLGAWGALIPFIGPAFSFGFGGTQSWSWTAARFWLEVLPGIAAFLGGLMMLISANRPGAMAGAWLAIAAGTWFLIGPTLAKPWHLGDLGVAMGGTARQALTWLLLFYGLGAAILHFASTAWGRLSVRSLRDMQHAEMHHQLRTQARGGGMFGLGGSRQHDRQPEPAQVGDYRDRADDPRAGDSRMANRDSDERTARGGSDVYPDDTLRLNPADGSRSGRASARDARSEHGDEGRQRGQRPIAHDDTYPSDTAYSRDTGHARDAGHSRDDYPSDTAYSSDTARSRDSARSRDGDGAYPGDNAYPSGGSSDASGSSSGGRHEAPHEGFSEKLGQFETKIGRAFAKHGIGGGRQH